jgi:hypothetical protein
MTKEFVDIERTWDHLRFEFDGTVDDVIEMLNQRKLETPEGSTLILSYETVYDYGDSYNVVKMYDRRLETDEEYKMRLAQEAEEKENRMRAKRAQLEALKKELGEE